MAGDIVSGSVIQRTFVGARVPDVLFAASVPVSELGVKCAPEMETGDFRRIVAELLATPSNALLDEAQYQDLVGKLARLNWPRRWLRFAPDPVWEDSLFEWDSRHQEVLKEMGRNERPIRIFAEHSLALILATDRKDWSSWYGLPLPQKYLSRRLEIEADDTALHTGIACFNATIQRPQGTADFTKAVLEYDLPFGNSPRASSDSLLRLLDSGKKMCLAPMAAGGVFGVTQLTQGQYVAAILSVGTGSLMTLILLGSVAVGSLLVARVAQRQSGAKL